MNAIVFNNAGTSISQQMESLAIRASYVVCNSFICAGTSLQTACMREFYKQAGFEHKVLFIETHAQANQMDFAASEVLRLWKQMKKVKYKNAQQLRVSRDIEATINKLFNSAMDEMMDRMNLTGMPVLAELLGADGAYVLQMDLNDGEKQTERVTAASTLLKGESNDLASEKDFETPQGKSLFCVTHEFFTDIFAERGPIYGMEEQQAGQAANVWMRKCFTFPNLNLLNALELKSVKKALEIPGAEFRRQCNECIEKADADAEANVRDIFKKNILPHAASLQAAIAQNEILRRLYATQHSTATIELWMGEVPTEILWKFYKTFNVIEDNTWEVLSEALKNDARFKKRQLVMGLKANSSHSNIQSGSAAPASNDAEIKSVRKFISLD